MTRPHDPSTLQDAQAAPSNRREILGRMAALVAGPLLLGRQALDLTLRDARQAPPEAAPPPPTPRLAITPPSNSVKRRG